MKELFYFNFLNQILTKIINFIFGFGIIFYLNKTESADVLLFQASVVLLATLSSSGLVNLILSENVNIELSTIIILNFLILFSFYLIFACINFLFDIYDLNYFYSLVGSSSLSFSSLVQARWQKDRDYFKLTGYNITLILIVICIFTAPRFILLNYDASYFIVSFSCAYFIVILFYVRRVGELLNMSYFNVLNLFQLFRWHIIYGIALTLGTQLDIFVLNYFITKNDLADYSLALKFYSLGLLFSGTFFNTILQVLGSNNTDIDQRLVVNRYFKIGAALSLFLTVIVYLFPANIIFKMLNLSVYINAFSLFRILWLSIAVSLCLSSFVAVFFIKNDMKIVNKVNMVIYILAFPIKLYISSIFFSSGLVIVTTILATMFPLFLTILYLRKHAN